MTQAINFQLKTEFRSLFPEYAEKLESVKSHVEIEELHSSFIRECEANLADALRNANVSLKQETDQTAAIALKKEVYETLINATGDTIKDQLHVIIDGLQRLKGMEKDQPGLVTAQILVSGLLSIGLLSTNTVVAQLAAGVAEATAAFAGVEIETVEVVCAISALVIVAILIPIIYFMEKPANCIILLINELDKPLTFQEHFNLHGKPILMTTPIPNGVVIPTIGTYPVAGLIATQKREDALVGTQYGFVMKYENTNFAFGVECPLTSIYQDNNCYCSFGENAKTAAEKTNSLNKQFFEANKDGINLRIRCNSRAGSIAYYVARAYRG